MSKKPTDFGAGLNSPVVQTADDPLLPAEALIPHTTNLTKRTFVRLAQLSFYSREEQQEIIEAALVEYFEKHKESDRELPPKQLQKLRNLKKLRRV